MIFCTLNWKARDIITEFIKRHHTRHIQWEDFSSHIKKLRFEMFSDFRENISFLTTSYQRLHFVMQKDHNAVLPLSIPFTNIMFRKPPGESLNYVETTQNFRIAHYTEFSLHTLLPPFFFLFEFVTLFRLDKIS